MTQSVDLADIARRPQRYWNADGLPELMMGLVWMLWGLSWLIGESLPRGTVSSFYWILTPALLALSGFASVWATKKLKARITFPRAGYVEWTEPTGAQRAAAAAVAMISAALLVVILVKARANGVERTAPLALGVLLSLAFVIASLKQRAPHLLALAGVALMLGLTAGAVNAGWPSLNWILVGVGLATCISGLIRLVLFLKRNPLEKTA